MGDGALSNLRYLTQNKSTAFLISFILALSVATLLLLLKQANDTSDEVPSKEPWKAYARWAKERGSSIVSLKARGRNIVVLNDLSCAIELLEKRWSNYSSRPEWPMLRLMGRADNVGLQRYGPRLRKCRKIIHDTLSARDAHIQGNLEKIIEDETFQFLRDLRTRSGEAPMLLTQLTSKFVASLIFKLTYGYAADMEHVRLLEESAKYSSQSMVPGKWLVDSYPFLQYMPAWFPGGGFKKWAFKARTHFRTLTMRPFNKVKQEMEKDAAPPSFVRDNLAELKDTDDSEMELIIAGTAASFHSAGTDTLEAALLTLILMMVIHPEVQVKAYNEIVSVVGRDRLPTTADCKSLTYLNAVIKEVYRYNPPVPRAMRSVERADYYDNQLIRRKSWMLVNLWAMTHDESEYKNPNKFSPERFLTTEATKDSRDIIFGFGRRRCPGIALANSSLMTLFAQLLAVYDVQPERDQNGVPIIPAAEFITGFTAPPKPFKCIFAPRSSTSLEIINRDF